MRAMRPEVKRWFKVVFCSLLVVFSVTIGFSDWVAPGDGEDVTTGSKIPDTTDEVPCAFIDDDETTLYTIEDALDKAASLSGSNSIYVIPGKNPTIKRNCKIASGDTLVLSYDASNPKARMSDTATLTGAGFAESTASNLKSKLTIAESIVVENYGTIEVAGELSGGGGGQDACGQTKGFYSKISLDSNSSLVNYGSLYVYGYIDETTEGNGATVYAKSGSYVKYPLIIRDFRGGTNMLDFVTKVSSKITGYNYNASPFNQIDTRNMAVYTRYDYGCNVACLVNLYASNTQNSSLLNFIGSSGLFRISNANSYITSQVKKAPKNQNEVNLKSYSERVTTYCTYGKVNVGNVSLSLSGLDFSLEKYYFPFCFRQQIQCKPTTDENGTIIEEGYVYLPAYYKFLPGSSLIIDKNATVVCDGTVAVYNANQKSSDGTDLLTLKTDAPTYPTYYATMVPKAIVNGIFISNNFGGVILTESKDAVIAFSKTEIKCGEYATNHLLKTYPYANLKLQYYSYDNGQVSSILTEGAPQSYISDGAGSSYGFTSLTSNKNVNIVYKSGNNCTYSGQATYSVKMHSYYSFLNPYSDSELSAFKRTGYMLGSYSIQIGSSSYEAMRGSGVFISDKAYHELDGDNPTIYVKLNYVESIDITIYYNSDNNKQKTDDVQYEKSGDDWTYVLKAVDEIGLNLGTHWFTEYQFESYDLYPGVSEKNGNPARKALTPEGTSVNLSDEDLKSTITNKCMYIHVNRK